MKYFFLIIALFLHTVSFAGGEDEKNIRNVLNRQIIAWNNGDIAAYMQAGYWQHDSLLFIGKSGPTYGYTETLQRYKTAYPDTIKMGKLSFNVMQLKQLDRQHYFVVGKWSLKRSVGDAGGYFTLLFQKIKDNWVIIADHSS